MHNNYFMILKIKQEIGLIGGMTGFHW